LVDQITGSAPQVPVGTDMQFEVGYQFLGAMVDASDFASVTAAVKLLSNVDTAALVSVTETPSSAGWNSNATLVAGSQLVPSYATYGTGAGSGATGTATVSGGVVTGMSVGSAGTGYLVPPTVWLVPPLGGTGAVVTAVLGTGGSAGTVASFTVVSGGTGYGGAPTVVVLPSTTYALGVQAGATYSWTQGANDTALWNGAGTLAYGSNLVNPTSTGGTTYGAGSPGNATLSGLTPSSFYYFVLGANDVDVDSIVSPPFFLTGNATTSVGLNGTGSATITSQVYPATAGKNVVPGALYYPSTTAVATGSSLVTGGATYTSAYQGSATIGSNTTSMTFTPGNTYIWVLGANDQSFNGSTAATGTFVATSASVLMVGMLNALITTQVFATTGANSAYALTGLASGSTYYWAKGANDVNVVSGTTTLTNSGFFTASSSQATLTGTGGSAVTATVQLVTPSSGGTFVAAGNTVSFVGTASAAVTATATGNAGWNTMSDQLCVVPLSHSQTSLSVPTGGSQAYWLLVTAVTTGGNVVLGVGQVNFVDLGNASNSSVPNNLISSGTNYSSGGSYTLNGLIVGGVYYWGQGANDTNVSGTGFTTLTSSGNFVAGATSVTLTGTASQSVTAAVLPLQVASPTGGKVAIPNGTAAGAFTPSSLGVTVPFTPARIEVSVAAGASDPPVFAQVVTSSISATGFTVNLSAPITSGNYVLYWDAKSY
jgi:hypothetical protein